MRELGQAVRSLVVDSAAKRGELPMHDRIAELRVRELHIAAEQDFDVADLELDHTPPGTARGAGTDSSLNSSGEGTRAWPPISFGRWIGGLWHLCASRWSCS
jgi:hypothetical protein